LRAAAPHWPCYTNFVEADERDAERLEIVEQDDQVLQVAAEPIELPGP
jgi:hypothetical protein